MDRMPCVRVRVCMCHAQGNCVEPLQPQLQACLAGLLLHVCGSKQQMDKAGSFAGGLCCCAPL